ncbi:MAG TPA: helix-turn-helix domain-containing protein [Steroidobacteraceae bacterium]|jgi:DNA-binding CsgD family transcriptional regulator|nr:helix-turn-helix domain-containing protein [Steroidobacteraceae bacterium]
MQREEWAEILASLASQLSENERRIAKAMAEGKSTPEIGKMLGEHRSMIWRKAQRIRARAKGSRS